MERFFVYFFLILQIITLCVGQNNNNQISKSAIIDPTAIIGKFVRIEDFVQIKSGVVVEDLAVIGKSTKIFENTFIGWQAKIGADSMIRSNVTIQKHAYIKNNAVVLPNSVIGEQVVLHENVVVGKNSSIEHLSMICKDAHIGNNVTIKAVVLLRESARIEDGSIIDVGADIGKHTIIHDNVYVGKRAKIYDGATVGNGVVIFENLHIQKNVTISDDRIIVPAPKSVHLFSLDTNTNCDPEQLANIPEDTDNEFNAAILTLITKMFKDIGKYCAEMAISVEIRPERDLSLIDVDNFACTTNLFLRRFFKDDDFRILTKELKPEYTGNEGLRKYTQFNNIRASYYSIFTHDVLREYSELFAIYFKLDTTRATNDNFCKIVEELENEQIESGGNELK